MLDSKTLLVRNGYKQMTIDDTGSKNILYQAMDVVVLQ